MSRSWIVRKYPYFRALVHKKRMIKLTLKNTWTGFKRERINKNKGTV